MIPLAHIKEIDGDHSAIPSPGLQKVVSSPLLKKKSQDQCRLDLSSLQQPMNRSKTPDYNETTKVMELLPISNYKGAANFKFRAKLGEGSVGEVYQVVHK